MERKSIPLELQHAGISYEGWATPSRDIHPDGDSASYRVVLNGVFFGHMAFLEGMWLISEQHPFEFTQAVGNALTWSLARVPVGRMQLAVDESESALSSGRGGPFGAVVVREGAVIGRSGNRVFQNTDPTSHAEILAIRDAC